MKLIESTSPVFARHQTFSPRYGWLKAAYDGAKEDPDIFSNSRKDSARYFGVGKNMVPAIKFWGEATKIIEKDKSKGNNSYSPTSFGHAFFDSEEGLDPFLEDPGTLWIFHWLLSAPPSIAPVWWLTFGAYAPFVFEKNDLKEFVKSEINAIDMWAKEPNGDLREFKIAEGDDERDKKVEARNRSLAKDVDQLFNMYGAGKYKGLESLEDQIDSPFRQLKIISRPASGSDETLRFNAGYKPGLSHGIISFITFDYLSRLKAIDGEKNIYDIDRLSNDLGTPGKILKISSDEIVEALETTSFKCSFKVVNSSGIRQLVLKDTSERCAHEVVRNYYEKEPPTNFINEANNRDTKTTENVAS